MSFLGRTLTLRQWRIEYEPDQLHVSRALKALGLTDAKGVATPGTDDMGGPTASQISELRRTAKWHVPPEEFREEDDLLTGEVLKLFQSVAARFNFLAMDRPDLLNSVKQLMRKMASPRTQDLTATRRHPAAPERKRRQRSWRERRRTTSLSLGTEKLEDRWQSRGEGIAELLLDPSGAEFFQFWQNVIQAVGGTGLVFRPGEADELGCGRTPRTLVGQTSTVMRRGSRCRSWLAGSMTSGWARGGEAWHPPHPMMDANWQVDSPSNLHGRFGGWDHEDFWLDFTELLAAVCCCNIVLLFLVMRGPRV